MESLSWMQLLFSNVTTTVGLKVTCELARKSYQAGLKATKAFRKNEPTIRDAMLGKSNYVLSP